MKIKFTVCGIEWEAIALGKNKYQKKESEPRSVAVTRPSSRSILFIRKEVTLKIVLHEVIHAHIHYLHVNNSLDMPLSDFEELIVSMLEERMEEIMKISKTLFKQLTSKTK
jgi:hypothetical protein